MSVAELTLAEALAGWAVDYQPAAADLELAQRALVDTIAVTLAARAHPLNALTGPFSAPGRWAAAAHVLDFDDLHMESTTHISVVCVPAVATHGGDEKAYLAAAGVMARLGTILGWDHYAAGWHATCTAGAPAAAAGVALCLGLDRDAVARAIVLAVSGAGGVQRAFGTDAKSLQVAAAVETGVRAAQLAAAGARVDLTALEVWCRLVGGRVPSSSSIDGDGPAIPNGLAIKLYPCCYALQRPIHAIGQAASEIDYREVRRVTCRAPAATVAPLIHHRAVTGLEGKFSLEYAVATALLDDHQGVWSFSDQAVRRAEAQRLIDVVRLEPEPGGAGLRDGKFDAELELYSGTSIRCAERFPPGAPRRPPTEEELASKLADCVQDLPTQPSDWTWTGAAETVRGYLSTSTSTGTGAGTGTGTDTGTSTGGGTGTGTGTGSSVGAGTGTRTDTDTGAR